jgi:hypothetical protein
VTIQIDDGPFRPASATDGIFDGRAEPFEFRLPDPLPFGRHRVVVRARDALGNLVTSRLVVEHVSRGDRTGGAPSREPPPRGVGRRAR